MTGGWYACCADCDGAGGGAALCGNCCCGAWDGDVADSGEPMVNLGAADDCSYDVRADAFVAVVVGFVAAGSGEGTASYSRCAVGD